MKNIFEYLKKNWKIALIIILVTFIAISGFISKCSTDQIEGVITSTQLSTALNKQKNDLTTKYLSENAETAKALEEAEKKISEGLKPVIKWQKADAAKKVDEARKDTSMTVKSDSAITAQERYNATLERKVKSDSVQISECDKRVVAKEGMVKSISEAYTKQIQISSDLNDALVKENKGKNLKWWALGVGAVAGFLIAR